jgi:hypothetical protein
MAGKYADSGKGSVPTWKRAVAWGLRVSLGEGSEGGPVLLEGGNNKQSMPSKGRDNKGKDEDEHQIRHDGGG